MHSTGLKAGIRLLQRNRHRHIESRQLVKGLTTTYANLNMSNTCLISVHILVVRTIHHLVSVVLHKDLRVIANALNVQVLPLVMESLLLQQSPGLLDKHQNIM